MDDKRKEEKEKEGKGERGRRKEKVLRFMELEREIIRRKGARRSMKKTLLVMWTKIKEKGQQLRGKIRGEIRGEIRGGGK